MKALPFLPTPGKPIPLGRVEGEGEKLYRSRPAITRSIFLDFLPPNRPSYFYGRHVAGSIPAERVDKRTQGFFDFGCQCNTLILEGEEKFNSLYVEKPYFGRSTAAKVKRVEWMRANQDRAHISPLFWRRLHRMRAAVRAHPIAAALLQQGTAETTWRIQTPEALWQCRTDWFVDRADEKLCEIVNAYWEHPLLQPGDAVPIDLKTCQTLSDDGYGSFRSEMTSLRYDVQEAFYKSIITTVLGLQRPVGPMFFIAVEKTEPIEAAVYVVAHDDALAAWAQVSRHLARLRECLRTNVWPGIDQRRVHAVEFPVWRRKAMERDAEEMGPDAFAGAEGGDA